jgi:hypothetical protein
MVIGRFLCTHFDASQALKTIVETAIEKSAESAISTRLTTLDDFIRGIRLKNTSS